MALKSTAQRTADKVNTVRGIQGESNPVDSAQVENFWTHYPLNESHPVNQLILVHTPKFIREVLDKAKNKTLASKLPSTRQ